LLGFDFYANTEPLLQRLKQLDMWAQIQVAHDGLLDFLPMLARVAVTLSGFAKFSQADSPFADTRTFNEATFSASERHAMMWDAPRQHFGF
jgi:hypothetical protein